VPSQNALLTGAVWKDGGYVLNGVKRFITDAQNSSFAQVLAVTDPGKGARGRNFLPARRYGLAWGAETDACRSTAAWV
jgi:alkylation response protein AidB-like acyl-CoA dehydrogenase